MEPSLQGRRVTADEVWCNENIIHGNNPRRGDLPAAISTSLRFRIALDPRRGDLRIALDPRRGDLRIALDPRRGDLRIALDDEAGKRLASTHWHPMGNGDSEIAAP